MRIRNNFAFHYQGALNPRPWYPFVKKGAIFISNYEGDLLSGLSTDAIFSKLIELIDSKEKQQMKNWDKTKWEKAIRDIGQSILKVAEVYCNFLATVLVARLIKHDGNKKEVLPISQAPKYNEQVIKFFIRPPSKEELEYYKRAAVRGSPQL